MIAPRSMLYMLASAFALSACNKSPKPPREPKPPSEARIEKTIELPGGQGTAHVLVVPTSIFESARCVESSGPPVRQQRPAPPRTSTFPSTRTDAYVGFGTKGDDSRATS